MATNTSSTSTAISSPPQASSTTNVGPYPGKPTTVIASSAATSLVTMSTTLSAAMSSSTTTTHHHSHSPVIAGGVVGGLGGLLVLVGLLLWLRRRHRKPKVAPSAEFMAYAAALRSPAPTPDVTLMRASSPEPDSPRHASHGSHTDPLFEKLREAVAQMRHLHPKGGEGGGIVDELQGDDLFGV
ncbi:hypothetical protein DAEQUDRAFT_727220 [Daedalea quercina L-15889]|uniref:Mid2 domain-containing protein n=1 Tax=Daedalea quercina L-15889 TaxID=1314783 RepID=A0A165Q5K9_9APHY|nr:hypothetical protein DAEQUDRAFT_727220 [Daedalea quercina L-15889]